MAMMRVANISTDHMEEHMAEQKEKKRKETKQEKRTRILNNWLGI